MKTPNTSRPARLHGSFCLFYAFVFVFAALSIMTSVHAQDESKRTESLRLQIARAEEQHAPKEQLGALWLRAANEYYAHLDLQHAEGAFTHAIVLLRSAASRRELADAYGGLGSLYLSTRRIPESRMLLRKSLTLYREIHDSSHDAHLLEALAIGSLLEKDYHDTERETSEALALLQTQPDAVEQESALLTRSYARSFQGHCQSALDDIEQARTVVSANFDSDSLEAATLLMAHSSALWRCGLRGDAERAVLKALDIIDKHAESLRPLFLTYRISALRQYLMFLEESHRKEEARRVEATILSAQAKLQPTCSNCTVNAAALSSALLP